MKRATAQPAGTRTRIVRPRGFTLLEMGVVAAVMLTLMAVGGFAYTGVLKSQESNSGRTMLDTSRVEGRRIAATNGYQFPADLASRLKSRAAVSSKAAQAKFEFIPGASHMPGTVNNRSTSHRISVVADGLNIAAYAVQTAGDDSTGNCWLMVEDLANTESDTTRWGKVEQIAAGGCAANRVAMCPQMLKGTSTKPTPLTTLRECPAR